MKEIVAEHPGRRADSVIANLALMYHRHNDPARALALGLAALHAGPATPRVILVIAASFLKTGDAEQARAALSRFDGDAPRLSRRPNATEAAAAELLKAKTHFRMGAPDEARAALARARALRAGP